MVNPWEIKPPFPARVAHRAYILGQKVESLFDGWFVDLANLSDNEWEDGHG